MRTMRAIGAGGARCPCTRNADDAFQGGSAAGFDMVYASLPCGGEGPRGKKFQILVYEYRRECKALIIQCAWRCYLARCRRAACWSRSGGDTDAAIMIQCRERQRQAKAEVDRRRLAREQEKPLLD